MERGKLRIEEVSTKITALERRRDHLKKKIEQKQGSPGSLNFDRAEAAALDSGIDALVFHRAIVNRLDEPLSMLRETLEAMGTEMTPEQREVAERANQVLDAFGA